MDYIFFMEPSLCLVICLGILVLFSPDFIWCFGFQCLLILMTKPAENSSKYIILNHFFKNFLGGGPPNPPCGRGSTPSHTHPRSCLLGARHDTVVIWPFKIFLPHSKVFFLTPITCLSSWMLQSQVQASRIRMPLPASFYTSVILHGSSFALGVARTGLRRSHVSCPGIPACYASGCLRRTSRTYRTLPRILPSAVSK